MSEIELAAWLGLMPARIRSLARDKIVVRSSRGRFDVAASTLGYCRHLSAHARTAGRPSLASTDELKAERLRLTRAQADAQELKAAAARREMVPAEEVSREWTSVLRDVRAAVLAVPSRFGAALPHLTANDVAALDIEIRAALEGLANDNA
ncbi:MAG: hypothetical protein ABS35_25710 [Kaistia sp. SCN 65-12]|nr:MAG: hypothetical protein ABS35_25710 [Kaistia sp. SCN 65-12]